MSNYHDLGVNSTKPAITNAYRPTPLSHATLHSRSCNEDITIHRTASLIPKFR
jgi:hypothetical protein